MTRSKDLDAIFDADRALRAAEARFFASTRGADAAEVLEAAVREAAEIEDPAEGAMRLERLADLCAQVPGPAMVDAMIAILNHGEPPVRVAAGEALLDVAYERYAEVARGVERALDAPLSGPAMAELPYILAEVGEPSALPLLRRFLAHHEADAVAAAVESLVQLADPAAVEDLEELVDDERVVTLEDLEEETTASIGELAREAIEALESLED